MNDSCSPNRSRLLPWLARLLLTVVAGGTLAGLSYWSFAPAYNDPLRSAFLLHVATIYFWAYVVATSLYHFDGNAWRKSVARGSVLALVASVVIAIVVGLILLLVTLLVDSIIH